MGHIMDWYAIDRDSILSAYSRMGHIMDWYAIDRGSILSAYSRIGHIMDWYPRGALVLKPM